MKLLTIMALILLTSCGDRENTPPPEILNDCIQFNQCDDLNPIDPLPTPTPVEPVNSILDLSNVVFRTTPDTSPFTITEDNTDYSIYISDASTVHSDAFEYKSTDNAAVFKYGDNSTGLQVYIGHTFFSAGYSLPIINHVVTEDRILTARVERYEVNGKIGHHITINVTADTRLSAERTQTNFSWDWRYADTGIAGNDKTSPTSIGFSPDGLMFYVASSQGIHSIKLIKSKGRHASFPYSNENLNYIKFSNITLLDPNTYVNANLP